MRSLAGEGPVTGDGTTAVTRPGRKGLWEPGQMGSDFSIGPNKARLPEAGGRDLLTAGLPKQLREAGPGRPITASSGLGLIGVQRDQETCCH